MADKYKVLRDGVADVLEVDGEIPAVMAAVAFSFTDRKLAIEVVSTSTERPDFTVLRVMPPGHRRAVNGLFYMIPQAVVSGAPDLVDRYHALLEVAQG